jgi:hypothetical protein
VGFTVFRSDAPHVVQEYSTSTPSRIRKRGLMDLIVIGWRFSQTGQTMIGISRAGAGFLGIDRKRPTAAADEIIMGNSFSAPSIASLCSLCKS